jgi:hypothetical protein
MARRRQGGHDVRTRQRVRDRLRHLLDRQLVRCVPARAHLRLRHRGDLQHLPEAHAAWRPAPLARFTRRHRLPLDATPAFAVGSRCGTRPRRVVCSRQMQVRKGVAPGNPRGQQGLPAAQNARPSGGRRDRGAGFQALLLEYGPRCAVPVGAESGIGFAPDFTARPSPRSMVWACPAISAVCGTSGCARAHVPGRRCGVLPMTTRSDNHLATGSHYGQSA